MMLKLLSSLHHRICQGKHYKWWALTVVQCGIFFVGINATIVNLALPSISEAFDADISLSQLIIVTYSVAIVVFLPITGQLPHFLGRKKVMIGGFFLFTFFSAGCAFATSLEMLICLQVFLAIGSAALLANSNAVTHAVFPSHQHGLAMGINGTVASIGYGTGLILGGYLIENYGWQSIYWINFPFGIFAIVLGLLVLSEKKILFQNRAPLFTLQFFKNKDFVIGSSSRFLLTTVSSACLFVVPFFTQINLNFSPIKSGLVIAPFSIALFFAGPLGGKLSDLQGAKKITCLGFLFCSIGLIVLISLNAHAIDLDTIKIALGMFFLGWGVGFFVPANNKITLNAIPSSQVGIVSGFLWSMAYLGTAAGTGLSGILLPKTDVDSFPEDPHGFVQAQRLIFFVLLAFSLLGLVLCLVRGAINKR